MNRIIACYCIRVAGRRIHSAPRPNPLPFQRTASLFRKERPDTPSLRDRRGKNQDATNRNRPGYGEKRGRGKIRISRDRDHHRKRGCPDEGRERRSGESHGSAECRLFRHYGERNRSGGNGNPCDAACGGSFFRNFSRSAAERGVHRRKAASLPGGSGKEGLFVSSQARLNRSGKRPIPSKRKGAAPKS